LSICSTAEREIADIVLGGIESLRNGDDVAVIVSCDVANRSFMFLALENHEGVRGSQLIGGLCL